jgi:hypothetical protein
VVAGAPSLLRWYANSNSVDTIEYSTQPNVWRLLVAGVAAGKRNYYWQVPDTNCRAILRYRKYNQWFYSDSFWVATALRPTTGFICADSFALYWPPAKAINQYQIYRMGATNMEPLVKVIDTFAVLRQVGSGQPFYAVAPIIDGYFAAAKSYGFNYLQQGAGCYINTFFGTANGSSAILDLQLGAVFNIKTVYFEYLKTNAFEVIATYQFPLQNSYQAVLNNLPNGVAIFRVRLLLQDGSELRSNLLYLYIATGDFYQLYPVPVQRGQPLYLLRGETTQQNELLIFDASGRQVFVMSLTDKLTPIDTHNFPAGFYSYQLLLDGRRVQSGKIIVQ